MQLPRNTKITFDAYLLADERDWLHKYYPDTTAGTPLDQVAPPRDAYTITIPEAAKILGITRTGAYKMAVERGEFTSCRKVGPPEKPIYLLDLREVLTAAARRSNRGQA